MNCRSKKLDLNLLWKKFMGVLMACKNTVCINTYVNIFQWRIIQLETLHYYQYSNSRGSENGQHESFVWTHPRSPQFPPSSQSPRKNLGPPAQSFLSTYLTIQRWLQWVNWKLPERQLSCWQHSTKSHIFLSYNVLIFINYYK